MRGLSRVVVGVVTGLIALSVAAKDEPPLGLIAASVGDAVVLLDPAARQLASFDTGPVGWLYPAPGGVLFAPDVVHGVTTVIDLRTLRVAEKLDGVTTPVFGPFVDRYMVVTGKEVLAVSYPDRARIYSFPLEVASPWQVAVVGGGSSMIVLDRRPDGSGGSRLLAADLLNRKAVYADRLPVDVSRMVMMPELGVLAMAASGIGTVRWVEPRARQTVLELAVDGTPRDVAVAGDGRMTLVGVDGGDGGHHLELVTLRSKKSGLVVKHREQVPLASAPVAVAVDFTGRYAAVATADARLLVVDCKERKVMAGGELPATPRHLVWWIATAAGPHVPMWSDRSDEPAELPEPLIH